MRNLVYTLSVSLFLSTTLLGGFASAQKNLLSGTFQTPFGEMVLAESTDSSVKGFLKGADQCGRKKGSLVFSGSRLDDSVTAMIKICYKGSSKCKKHVDEIPLLLLVSPDGSRMTGVAHYNAPPAGCQAIHQKEGVVFSVGAKVKPITKKTPKPKTVYKKPKPKGKTKAAPTRKPTGKALDKLSTVDHDRLMIEGNEFLRMGEAEKARERFIAITKKAKQNGKVGSLVHANAYNGVGVTFYLRERYAEAMENYKMAIRIDPNVSDSYYNLACLFALKGDKEQSFRYLNMAVLNGYIDLDTLDQDPDLANLRDDPRYQKIKDGLF